MFARVALDSPLPQLDRLFDYEIADGLLVEPGVRVEVPFGNSKQSGFVVSLTETTDWAGKVSKLENVISPLPVLKPHIYELVAAVAARQACSFGDVIGSAIPVRAVRAEKAFLARELVPAAELVTALEPMSLPKLAARVVEPRSGAWQRELLQLALQHVLDGASAIIAVPDFRDIARLVATAKADSLDEHVVVYSSADTRTESYEAFLECLSGKPVIVLGARNALYAPVSAAGIYVWDDGDQSHYDQSSPYATTREIALLRQAQTGCNLAFLSHSRSVEVERLVSIGYLTEASDEFAKPRVSTTTGDFRVDSAAWLAIRDGLETGSVLVQVAGTGVARSLYCKQCSTRVSCGQCNGPIWIDASGTSKCRWCNAFAQGAKCRDCGSMDLRQGKAGATRTVSEFGKSFPGVLIVEARADDQLLEVDDRKKVVVSTPGIEPAIKGGYQTVVILDCQDALNRDTLKATEDAVRNWANAIALLAPQGRAVLVGVQGQLATEMSLWQIGQIAHRELGERIALKFPPALRVVSGIAAPATLAQMKTALASIDGVEVLGITPVENGESRLIARFPYSQGKTVSDTVKALQLSLGSGNKRYNAKSGRAQRPITVKLDDPQVL